MAVVSRPRKGARAGKAARAAHHAPGGDRRSRLHRRPPRRTGADQLRVPRRADGGDGGGGGRIFVFDPVLRFLWAHGAEPESGRLPPLRRGADLARHDQPPAPAGGLRRKTQAPRRMKGRVDLSRHDAPRETFAEGDPESGPFASAVREGGTLTLARDAFGERPLLYCARGSEVWFASHAQDLRAMGAPLGQIDRGALSDYLELGYVPSPATM